MNIADVIEKFILHKLSGQSGNIVILKRNELADELSCAPSQISYVLNTRFTIQRGFIVESRRGLGGFVRIVKVPVDTIVVDEEVISKHLDIMDFEELIGRLRDDALLSEREAVIIKHFIPLLFERFNPAERARVVRTLIMKIAGFSKGGD